MKKAFFGALSFVTAIIGSLFLNGCNSDGPSIDYPTVYYSNTAVTGFSLVANSNILYNLDSVYFSIDLDNAKIFNATPLPVGTPIDHMLVTITTDNCSTVELKFMTRWGNDTTINYLENQTDSINFANGPVTLHVVSYDELMSRDYSLIVNVYDQNPDSIAWVPASTTVLQNALASRTIQMESTYYTLTNENNSFNLYSTENLFDAIWEKVDGFDLTGVSSPNVNSFIGNDNGEMFIIDNNNALYMTSDMGQTWDDTGIKMTWIYGTYNDSILGVCNDGSSYYGVNYPSGSTFVMPSDMPVTLTGSMTVYETQWAVNPMGVFNGGQAADGSLSGDTWAYDGGKWSKISKVSLEPASGRSTFRYVYAVTDSTNWRTTYDQVLYTIGGRSSVGMVEDVYYSLDMGIHWVQAPKTYSLPDDFPKVANSQIFVADHLTGLNSVSSRAIAPITEWECPYIYMYGGNNNTGQLNKSVWQGVLVRFTYKPLQ